MVPSGTPTIADQIVENKSPSFEAVDAPDVASRENRLEGSPVTAPRAMRLFHRFTQGELRLTRIEAFSDGIFAVAVTLLVLDLKVPALHSPNDVRELALARHADYGFMWLNSLFLMGQSFIPFPTAMVGEYHGNALAVSFFGGVFALNTLLFMALQAYLVSRLIKPELVALQDPHALRKAFLGPLCYLVGAAAAWIYIPAAFVIYALTPLLYITPPQGPKKARSQSRTMKR